jgi:hypothetical protein
MPKKTIKGAMNAPNPKAGRGLQRTPKQMVDKTNAIIQGATILASKTSDWQTIKQFLSNRVNNIQLTATQKKKLERYQFTYNQLSSGKFVEKEVVEQLSTIYGVDKSTAYEDLSDAKELFGFLFSINKLFEIKVQLDLNRIMQQKAKDVNDFRGFAALEKNRTELLKLIPEIEDTPGEHFTPHINEIVFDPSLIGAPEVNMNELLKMINERRGVTINLDAIPEAEVIPNENQ